MKKEKTYVGIDISKDYFDVAVYNGVRHEHYRFNNEAEGFKQLLLITGINVRFIMEASGPYYINLATFLYEQGSEVSVVNPLVIKRFAQMRLMRAKTDKKDAGIIAEYALTEQPELWQPDPVYMIELRQLQALYDQFIKQQTALRNQLHALLKQKAHSSSVKARIELTLTNLAEQIEGIMDDMQQLIKTHHSDQLEHISSIPGIGKKTAILLIVISGGFSRFESAKQLSAYIGLSPRIFTSGSSVRGKVKICKMGMSRIRSMLYMCAWSAIRFNQACKSLYQRLKAKGKPGPVALIAVANKLLKQALTLAKRKDFYDENYQPKLAF